MEDEIEIGEYVRTNNHGIKRIDTIWENKTVNKYAYEIGSEWDGELYSTIKTTDIVKHSKDIIDLIKEGDYVNGYKVLYVCNEEPCPSGKYVDIDCNKPSEESYFFEDEIKTILTKEQYNANCFLVKEEKTNE